MVQIKCDCIERYDAKINSYKAFMEIKNFFETQEKKGLFHETNVKYPYFTYGNQKIYATKWYRCTSCKCLWEFNYPDFPKKGFVRKFIYGQNYTPFPLKWTGMVLE